MTINLHPKQCIAFKSTAREILYGGAAGGGKSHLMRVIAIALCMQVAGIQIYIFRRLSDDLYKNHMEGAGGFFSLLAEMFESNYASYNASKNFIRFWNGAKIHLCHCQWGEEGTDEIPETYLLQCMQYMDILGAEVCFVAVLIGGNDFRMYVVNYDKDIAKYIRDEAERFWNDYVLAGEAPPARTASEILEMFTKTRRETLIATQDVEDTVNELRKVKAQIKELQENEEILRDQICVYLEDKEDLINPQGETLVTWRSAKPSKRTAWQKVVAELDVPQSIIDKHTSESVSRRFLVK